MKNLSIKRLINLPILFLSAGILIQVAALIVYIATGVDEFNSSLSTPVLIFSIASICLGLVLLVLRLFGLDEAQFFLGNYDLFIVISYLLALFAFMFYIISRVNYITNIFVSIDGTKVSFVFVLTVLVFLVSFVLFLLAGLMYKKLLKEAKEGGQTNEAEAI